jgi:Domain of unknown function (DUF4365)
MDLSAQKEQFSNAYLQSIASTAGFSLYKPMVDDDSVDWGIAAQIRTGIVIAPRLELQLKSTARTLQTADSIRYPLKLKNYDDLRLDGFSIPRILVVLLLPEQSPNWLRQTDDETCLQVGAYWISLRGLPTTTNSTTVTLQIPRANLFTSANLQAMMEQISQGQRP